MAPEYVFSWKMTWQEEGLYSADIQDRGWLILLNTWLLKSALEFISITVGDEGKQRMGEHMWEAYVIYSNQW